MPTEPRKRGLSPAQVRYLNEHVPAFMAWLNATGQAIGMTVKPWQKRIVEALIRKNVLEPDGRITDYGMKAHQRAALRAAQKAVEVAKRNGATIHPRVAEIKDKIQGKTASLIIVDDPENVA